MNLPPVARVLRLLEAGYSVAQVERLTGWPAHGIRRLVARQRGWLIGADGRVVLPGVHDVVAPPRFDVEIVEPRPAGVLWLELKAQKEELRLTWRDVLDDLGFSDSTLDHLRRGQSSTKTLARVEAWLAHTAPRPQEMAS